MRARASYSEAAFRKPAQDVCFPAPAAEDDVPLANGLDLHTFRLARAGGEQRALEVVRERLEEVRLMGAQVDGRWVLLRCGARRGKITKSDCRAKF